MIALIGLFGSCSTEFDVNADWEDITVVYALLDQNDDTHFIKINKAFLGPSNAYDMAAISDSLYYDSLVVELEEWSGTSFLKPIPCIKSVNEYQKEDGIFANDVNILYKTSEVLNPENEYRLKVFVPKYNKEVESSTKLIHGLAVRGNFSYDLREVNIASDDLVEVVSAANARMYDLILRFHYYETTDELNFTHDSIDYVLPRKITKDTEGGEIMEFVVNGGSLRRYIASHLEQNPAIKRVARSRKYQGQDSPNAMDYSKGALDFIFTMGGDDLYTYIQVNQPSQGIVQEKPAFTNINNGVGLFSCRNSHTIPGKELSDPSLDSLALSVETRDLNFRDSNGTYWFDY